MGHDNAILLSICALVLCGATAWAARTMLRLAFKSPGETRNWWIGSGSLVIGFGLWDAQIMALLASTQAADANFLFAPTIISLFAALLGTWLSLTFLRQGQGPGRALLCGAGMGLTQTCVHYLGLSALAFQYDIGRLDQMLLVAGLASNVGLAALAMLAMTRRRPTVLLGNAGSWLLMMGAVIGHTCRTAALDARAKSTPTHIIDMVNAPALDQAFVTGVLALVALGLVGCLVVLLILKRRKDIVEARRMRELRLFMRNVTGAAIYMLDPEGRVKTWNKGAQMLKQYTAEEIIGEHFSRFYPPDLREQGLPAQALQQALDKGLQRESGMRLRKDGSTFIASITIEPLYDTDGTQLGFIKITRDITESRTIENQRDLALGNMQQGLLLLDAQRRLVLHNQRVAQLYHMGNNPLHDGMSLDEVIAVTVGHIVSAEALEDTLRQAHELYAELLDKPGSHTIVTAETDGLVHALTSRRLEDGGWVVTIDDITERHFSAKRLEYMATHDSLTNLPNRARFADMLNEALARARMCGEQLAAVTIDLDDFKNINDIHGHGAGDQFLRETAMRLELALAGRGRVARLGGDEFAAFMALPQGDDGSALADALVNAMHFGFHVDGSDAGARVDGSGSLGMSIYPHDGITSRELMLNADLAMDRAKSDPLRHWHRYLPEMDEEVRERRTLQADLRLALERDEFDIVYQVQCAVADGSITGYEALLRWNHATHGPIPPTDFIPLAEANGLILPIGEWVLRRVCREAAQWPVPYKVAVNVSPVQLIQPNLPDIIMEALLEAGLPARQLEIEITETAIIADKRRALHNLRRIKHLGVSVAIDDFGTGYSSLDTLSSFAFDKIKIDRSFLKGVHKDEQSRNIVRAVLGLGRSLNLPVLAEGVETEADLALLRQENCHQAQGFYFGKPGKIIFGSGLAAPVVMPAEDPGLRIRRRRPKAA
jgi:diguanylate cyclase (GGDEF)-like protein/PAS domain S-box-containing protein